MPPVKNTSRHCLVIDHVWCPDRPGAEWVEYDHGVRDYETCWRRIRLVELAILDAEAK
jgi:hypothetical protein